MPLKKNGPRTILSDEELRLFLGLIVTYSVLAGISVFLLQSAGYELPAPVWVVAIANMGLVGIIYGILGYIGLRLSKRIGIPDMLDKNVSSKERYGEPLIIGLGLGLTFVMIDLLLGTGLPHPPFPGSIIASVTAGIGEELMFRLFFISFWTYLLTKIIKRQEAVYWIVSLFSAISFALGHLPSVMMIMEVTPIVLAEMIILNGLLSIITAYYLKKSGFLAAVGIHIWTDIVWHVLYGLI